MAGVNLAVVYGFGLIVAALVLALVYMLLCRAEGAAGRRRGQRGGRAVKYDQFSLPDVHRLRRLRRRSCSA